MAKEQFSLRPSRSWPRATTRAECRLCGAWKVAHIPNHIEWLVESGPTSTDGVAASRLLAILAAGVEELTVEGKLSVGHGTSLRAKLSAATEQLSRGNRNATRGQMGAFQNEVQDLIASGGVSEEDGGSLVILAGWVLDAIR